MIAGAGGNIGVQVGDDGVVVVDAGRRRRPTPSSRRSRSSADGRFDTSSTPAPIRITSAATRRSRKAGQTLFNTEPTLIRDGNDQRRRGVDPAAEKVLQRMSAPTGQPSPFPAAAWPTETFHARRQVHVPQRRRHRGAAPAGRAHRRRRIVFFRRSDVVVAGDIIDTTRFPVIDVARGGSIQGEIDALNRLVELAIPSVPLAVATRPARWWFPATAASATSSTSSSTATWSRSSAIASGR